MDLMNKVMLAGNLTRDPELRQTNSGKAVAEICLALDGPGGTREDPEPVFVDVVLWERTAETAGEYLKKGSAVLIEGRLRMDRWEDKQTKQTRTKLKVTGDRMKFLNLASREQTGSSRNSGREQRSRQPVG